MKIMGPLCVLMLFIFVPVGHPSPVASGENGPNDDVQEKVIVGDIHFVRERTGDERVCFSLSRFCNPAIFSIPGKKPRVVIDIKPVRQWHGKPDIQSNGNQIRRVRSHLHNVKETLRIVLDLNPSMDFMVEPRYYEAECVYCVHVLCK